ncbi:MAG: hypothetical protein K2X03_22120 [Bryobacteraceae bacterium]|nr:hypothetical protein [Bryobacteraceae bacterium]
MRNSSIAARRDLQAQRPAQELEPEPAPNEPKPTPEEQAAEAKRRAFHRHINIKLGRPADWEPPTQ